jgi:hypothetical protein
MASLARADLESLLRARKLDGTLTTARPWLAAPEAPPVATGLAALDAELGGGVPRGHVSALAGPPSSGRRSLLVRLLAGVTADGELAALIDARDTFDPESAVALGLDLSRLLWIRGGPVTGPDGRPATLPLERQVDRALKAAALVLQAGGFGVVALDFADVPDRLLRGYPFTTWLRLARLVEGGRTACVLVAERPLAPSAGGVTLVLAPGGARWSGDAGRARLFRGLEIGPRVVRARRAG